MKTIALLSIFTLMSLTSWTQAPDVLWYKNIEEDGNDAAYDVIESSDGHFVFTGESQPPGVFENDAILIKTNSDGSVIWQKRFGGDKQEGAFSIEECPDNGYIIAGYKTLNFGSLEWTNMWLIKTNMDGDTLWTKTLGSRFLDSYAKDINLTEDGGFIIAGTSRFQGPGSGQYYIIKTDENGVMEWEKYYGSMRSEANAIEQTKDGGYVAVGTSNAVGENEEGEVWVIKLNASGDTLWTQSFGEDAYDVGHALTIDEEGNIYITGGSYKDGFSRLFASKLTSEGSIEWFKIYTDSGPEEIGNDITLTENNGIVLCGFTSSDRGALIQRIDKSGEIKWYTSIHGDQNMHSIIGESILPLNDGKYLVTGRSTYMSPDASFDVFYSLLDKDITSSHSANEEDNYLLTTIQCFPNPARTNTNVKYFLPRSTELSIQLFDLHGTQLYSVHKGWQEAGHHQKSVDIHNLPTGVYILSLTVQNFSKQVKLMVVE